LQDSQCEGRTRQLVVTFFWNYAAQTKREEELTWQALADRIRSTTQRSKDKLPWLKLARFGDQRTDKGSLRHDANVLAISGIEADYDGEQLGFDDARELLTKAGIASILYTSPSHAPDKPRWRVLCPTSEQLAPGRRRALLGRLNGLFRGVLSVESWTLSQSYYYGSVKRNTSHQVTLIDGQAIDELDELDETWTGKPGTQPVDDDCRGNDWSCTTGSLDTSALLRDIREGKSYHTAMIRLAGRYARRGTPLLEARRIIIEEMEGVFPPDRDERWRARRYDLDRCLEDIYGKEADRRAREASIPPEQGRSETGSWNADSRNKSGATEPDVWGEPDVSILRLNRRPPPTLPLAVFGTQWFGWLECAAEAACCPVDYVVAPLLASSSALIGNARWPQAWRGWEEPPNLWLCAVGDSGDGKSPGSDALFRHVLPELERRMQGDYPDRRRKWETAVEVAELRRNAWKKNVSTAQKDGRSPPSLPTDAEVGTEPQAPRLRQNDVTIEKVANIIATAAPKGLLMIRDELAGFLLGMTSYNDAARAFWLEAYGGRPYRVERQKNPEPIVVNHLAVSWFGTIQPDRLAEVMEGCDDGLLARFCTLWPEPVPFDRSKRAPDLDFAIRSLDRLRQLDMQRTIDGALAPSFVPLVDAAQDRLVQFANEMQGHKELVAGLLRSACGKARGLALRLGLVLEFLWWCGRDGTDMPPASISDAAMEASTILVRDYILPMAERVYADAACSEDDRHVTTLARWIVKERPTEVRATTLRREVRLPGLTAAPAVYATCNALVDVNWLQPPPGSGGARGRPAAVYRVNPRLWRSIP
jgi:hypothetical protein